jgi:hypothetical protein
MELRLTDEQADELRRVLDEVLGDMSSEIADTENPSYRKELNLRREAIRAIRDQLG